ncbi:zf-HC2 domain-containing protein [Streptomyces sp. NPDC006296]|uniref:zf-HC2 domain-containing protein n=1 Tax=Streptomyces sp. NPDC006296 TaxID=3156746 RepID=UPI0033BB137D
MNSPADEHAQVQRMLGAWALQACSAEEAAQLDKHLSVCPECSDEAERLRGAVGLLHPHLDLDLAPTLRAEVLGACLSARQPEVSVPDYAQPYDAETARLDTLLADLSSQEWKAPVQLEWFEGENSATRDTSVNGVLGHLLAVDGTVAKTLGLPDPMLPPADGTNDPLARTEALWEQMDASAKQPEPSGSDDADPGTGDPAGSIRQTWRDQTYELIRTVSFGNAGVADMGVPYGEAVLPLRLAMLDRAFETWIHATDIADAVDYPYMPPVPDHLRTLISVAVEMLPAILAARRQAGLASPPLPVTQPGAQGRSLRLQIEGESGGDWYLPLDGAEGPAGPENCVSHVVLEEVEFCRLAAGHLPPRKVAAAHQGDQKAVLELLYAMASMSRI